MCVSCITYLFILIFSLFVFHVLVVSSFCVRLSPNSEHLPLYCALIGRKRSLVRICSVSSSFSFLFAPFCLCGSSHRIECSGTTAMRVQCKVCVCWWNACCANVWVGALHTLYHRRVHARTHTLTARCVENSPSVSYKKADKCDVGVTFELAFVEQTTPWASLELFEK